MGRMAQARMQREEVRIDPGTTATTAVDPTGLQLLTEEKDRAMEFPRKASLQRYEWDLEHERYYDLCKLNLLPRTTLIAHYLLHTRHEREQRILKFEEENPDVDRLLTPAKNKNRRKRNQRKPRKRTKKATLKAVSKEVRVEAAAAAVAGTSELQGSLSSSTPSSLPVGCNSSAPSSTRAIDRQRSDNASELYPPEDLFDARFDSSTAGPLSPVELSNQRWLI